MVHSNRSVLRAEDLDELALELYAEAEERGRALRAGPNAQVYRILEDEDSLGLDLAAKFRAVLEQQVLSAEELDNGRIRETEVQRELAKKALIALKVSGLRRLSRRGQVSTTGNIEKLAERVAQLYDWDLEKIARLVLENEEDGEENWIHSRVFPLREAPALDEVVSKLGYVNGRYVRTGVAKWFVFNSVERKESTVELEGTFHHYGATINRLLGDPSLTPVANRDQVEARLSAVPYLVTRGPNQAASKAVVHALGDAAQVDFLNYLPFADAEAAAPPGEMHLVSQFMVDLLVSRLPAAGMSDLNPIVAKFAVKDRGKSVEGALQVRRRPSLDTVRFEGEHLLDSVNACRLLMVDQRPLTDMSLQVVVKNTGGLIAGRCPLRIAIEQDHVHVAIGLGSIEAQDAERLHSATIDAVRRALSDGVSDADRIRLVSQRILARASADSAPDEADIFVGAEEDPSSQAAPADSRVDLPAGETANKRPAQEHPMEGENWEGLTPLETRVLRLAMRGMSRPSMARQTTVSEPEIAGLLRHIYAVLGVKDREAAIREAQSRGLRAAD